MVSRLCMLSMFPYESIFHKRFKLGYITILFVLLSACTQKKNYSITNENGVKTITNTGYNNTDLSVKIEPIMEIEGFSENNRNTDSFYGLKEINFDSEDNIYISCSNSLSITKYNKDGKRINSFVKKGNGPGEFDLYDHFLIINDTIIVHNNQKSAFFNTNCELIKEEKKTASLITGQGINYNDNLVLTYIAEMERRGKEFLKDTFFVQKVGLLQTNLESDSTYFVRKESCAGDFLMGNPDSGFFFNYLYAADGKIVYIAERLRDVYRIECFDESQEKVMEINRQVSPLNYTEEEKSFIESNLKDSFNQRNYENIYDKKSQIAHLHYDRQNNYLWVEKVMDMTNKEIIFDIYRDGILQNEYHFSISQENFEPLRDSSFFSIHNGKLYYYNKEENSIEVYKLSYS